MEFAVAIVLNGRTVVLSVHPTRSAADTAVKESAFSDVFVTYRKLV